MVTITNCIISFYCSCTLCCSPKATGITASGTKPKEGITVASGSRTLPLGTKIEWHGQHLVVQDRMSKRYSITNIPHFDIYLSNHQQALKKGRLWNQTVKIID